MKRSVLYSIVLTSASCTTLPTSGFFRDRRTTTESVGVSQCTFGQTRCSANIVSYDTSQCRVTFIGLKIEDPSLGHWAIIRGVLPRFQSMFAAHIYWDSQPIHMQDVDGEEYSAVCNATEGFTGRCWLGVLERVFT